MSTIVLVTGANRGLGKGLLQRYLSLPNHTVIAANRDPSATSSKELNQLPKAEGTKLVIVQIDVRVWQSSFDVVSTLQKEHGIDRLDIVIANAGVSYCWPSVAEAKEEDIRAHMEINAYGLVSLFQAVRPLLQKSTREAIFASLGSNAGSLDNQPPIPNAAYGPSKSAVAWYTIRINTEEPWLNSMALCPGLVKTDLGNAGVAGLGLTDEVLNAIGIKLLDVDESCDGMMQVLNVTTKENHGGKMIDWTGNVMAW